MASPQQPDQPARNAALAAAAGDQLAGLWPRIDWQHPAATEAVKTVYSAIATRYGQAAAASAAQFYDQRRSDSNAKGRYRATPADPVPKWVTDLVIESAFQGVITVTETPDTTSEMPVGQRVPDRLDNSIGRHVLQPGRDTVADNTAADPAKPRWIRVPTGPTTCAFCILLASRELGPNFGGYATEHNALFRRDGQRYHKHCDCQAVPVFPGDNHHDLSPNMRDYQDMYYKAAADAGTHRDATKILASMRQLHNLK